MLSRMPLGPTLALKMMVCTEGWSDVNPGMPSLGGNMVARGLFFRALISNVEVDSLASELLGYVPFEMSCMFVTGISFAGSLLSVAVGLQENVLVSPCEVASGWK
jgi:hypothetical protein